MDLGFFRLSLLGLFLGTLFSGGAYAECTSQLRSKASRALQTVQVSFSSQELRLGQLGGIEKLLEHCEPSISGVSWLTEMKWKI